jgi:DNA-binding response OmpR family regulator
MPQARCLVTVLLVGLAFFGLNSPAARGQDFILPYNKSPETAAEFWAASKYELGLGNHQRVAEMLRRFQERLAALGAEEQDKLLLAIYDRDGLSPLLRMANLKPVRETKIKDPATEKEEPVADVLIRRVTNAIEQRAGDPGRIEFFVNNLSKSAEERAYAITQLRIAGARAVPYMVAVLRNAARQREHEQIIAALVRMDSGMAPALLAALDANDPYLTRVIFTVFQCRADDRIVPYLWWFATAADVSADLKAAARALLARFVPGQAVNLREAVTALTALSDRFYRHEEQFVEPITIWKWEGQEGLVGTPASGSEAEEYYGIYWAKKALSLDAGYRPAQVLLVSLALEKAIERSGVEAPLARVAPQVDSLLAGTSSALLEEVLSRAMTDKRVLVVLGAVRALGEAGEARLLRSQDGSPTPLVKALSFPDARVQLAAAEAILSIPTPEGFVGASRLVRVLSRALGSDGQPRACVAAGQRDIAQRIAAALKQAGFEAAAFSSGSELFKHATANGEMTLVVLDASLGENDLPYTLSQLRTSADTAGVPIVLTGQEENARRLNALAGELPRTRVLTPTPVTVDLWKAEIEPLLKDSQQPALSEAERRGQGPKALDLLLRMARGEIPGYDLRPAEAAILKALSSDELAPAAAAVLAYRPGQTHQRALADLALRDIRSLPVRTAAAIALRHHLQRFGVLLSPDQINGLVSLAGTAQDPALREQALRLAAFLQPSAALEGARLLQFTPGAKAKEAPKSDEPKSDEPKPEEKKPENP